MVARLRKPHPQQRDFIESTAKREIIRAGRRSGKTTGAATLAVKAFLAGRRVLYAVPTEEQVGKFWFEVCRALQEPIDTGAFYKNETTHVVEISRTENRIRAKTAWDADSLRGDYADLLILDEFQVMHEYTWELVGAPMLLDNDGDAVFIYTPPSIRSAARSKARDPRHAAKMFKRAEADKSGRWAAFHFTSHDNPFISKTALDEIAQDMTTLGYRQEILAEDVEDNPGALWKRDWIEAGRVTDMPSLVQVAVAVDPSTTTTGDEWGIIGGGNSSEAGKPHLWVLEDASLQASPDVAARETVAMYNRLRADHVVAEANQGGEMITLIIHNVDPRVPVRLVHATRGKAVRAEPVSAVYEQGRGHHVGTFPRLEDELAQWEPGQPSPNRMDALVWLATDLVLSGHSATRPPDEGAEVLAGPSRWTNRTTPRWKRSKR